MLGLDSVVELQTQRVQVDFGFKAMGDLGVEDDAKGGVPVGNLDVVVVGTVDQHVQADPDDLHWLTMVVVDHHFELFLGQFEVAEGEVGLGHLVPLSDRAFHT